MCSSVVHYSNAESITTQSQIKLNLASGGKKLNPWLLTGFVDAEGSFSLSIRFNDKYSSK
jgi:intein-encoded DNA endonuclease-like protein